MKRNYLELSIEIFYFENNDIVTESNVFDNNFGDQTWD